MADGRHKTMAELDVGDSIYGTVRESKYRRYAVTTVLDKWITLKPAYRVVLEDETELIVSGDHRLLTNRGFKHVLNTDRSKPDRPHLTLSNHLVGTGAFAPQPAQTVEYRRGYLSGLIRGDGTLGEYSYERVGRRDARVYGFRLGADRSRGPGSCTGVSRRRRHWDERARLSAGGGLVARGAGDLV